MVWVSWESSIWNSLVFLDLICSLWRLGKFSAPFFLSSSLDYFWCLMFEFSEPYSTSSTLLLKLSIKCFSSVIVFFSTVISVWYFFKFSLYQVNHLHFIKVFLKLILFFHLEHLLRFIFLDSLCKFPCIR